MEQNSQPDRQVPHGRRLALGILLFFALAILAAIFFDIPLIHNLSDPDLARGIITFLIILSTIALAFLLVFQAFFSDDPSDERFRRAREIFAGFLGVLGTIVGFYFGAADRGKPALNIADIQIIDKQVVTYVTGGVPPYRYSITAKELKPTGEQVSQDGWIRHTFESAPKTGKLTIHVTDSRNQTVSKERKLEPSNESGNTPSQQPNPPQGGSTGD